MATSRIVVLGAGFGGLELATPLSDEFGDDIDVVLIDTVGRVRLRLLQARRDVRQGHGRRRAAPVRGSGPARRAFRAVDGPRDRSRRQASRDRRRVFEADILVVALGADLHPSATPGLLEGGHEFYTVAGAFALRDVLADFAGGRVVVGVTSTPFKCPPAPSETALLMHDLLRDKGLLGSSHVSLVMPMGAPIPPSPAASEVMLAAFAERDISWHPASLVRGLDPERKVALLRDGGELAYDLFLGVPVHRAPAVVVASGLTVDGWMPGRPADAGDSVPGRVRRRRRDQRRHPEGGRLRRRAGRGGRRRRSPPRCAERRTSRTYDGHGLCYLELGHAGVAKVDVTFRAGERPSAA